MNNRLQMYRKVEINTTNRGKIVVMLFSGAVTFLKKAKTYMINRDIPKKNKFINKTIDIINELNISLDMEKGQEISKNLRSIYLFLLRYLTEANIKNNPQMIEKAISILSRLHNAFDEIVSNPDYLDAHEINRRHMVENSIRRLV